MKPNIFIQLVHLVIISKEDKVLLMKWGPTIDFAGYFALPGGKIETNEPPEIAAQREAREELGIQITKLELLFKQNYIQNTKGYKNYLNYFYLVHDFMGVITYKEPDLCKELAFFSLAFIPRPIVPFVKPCFEELKHKLLIGL